MSVRLRGNVYWYDFQTKGKRFQGTCGTSNRNEAIRVESRVRSETNLGNFGLGKPKTVPTLTEFCDSTYKAELKRQCDNARTLEFYLGHVAKICAYKKLSSKSLDEIEEKDLFDFVAHCAAVEKISKSTTNKRMSTLRKAMRMAMRLKIIKSVPHFEKQQEPPPRDFVLSREFEAQYLALCPAHLYEFAVLAIESGMRMGECLGLEWEDVHFDSLGVGTRPYIQCRGTKSKTSNRYIPMSARLQGHLRELELRRQGDFVLHAVNDPKARASKDTLEDAHQRLRKKNELPREFVLHSLRHTMLTRLGEAGTDAFTIMQIAGHSSVTMSQRYVHPTAGQKDRAFDMVDKFNAAHKSPYKSPYSGKKKSLQRAAVPTKSTTVSRSSRVG